LHNFLILFPQLSHFFSTTENPENTEVIKAQRTKKQLFLFNGKHGKMFQKIYVPFLP